MKASTFAELGSGTEELSPCNSDEPEPELPELPELPEPELPELPEPELPELPELLFELPEPVFELLPEELDAPALTADEEYSISFVFAPTVPSTVSLFFFWNSFTAAFVSVPK